MIANLMQPISGDRYRVALSPWKLPKIAFYRRDDQIRDAKRVYE